VGISTKSSLTWKLPDVTTPGELHKPRNNYKKPQNIEAALRRRHLKDTNQEKHEENTKWQQANRLSVIYYRSRTAFSLKQIHYTWIESKRRRS